MEGGWIDELGNQKNKKTLQASARSFTIGILRRAAEGRGRKEGKKEGRRKMGGFLSSGCLACQLQLSLYCIYEEDFTASVPWSSV
jgi:hypothetical protein